VLARVAVLAALGTLGCGRQDSFEPDAPPMPASPTVTVLSIRAVRVSWPVESETTYLLQRRVGLAGSFAAVPTTVVPPPANGQVVFVDDDVQANTYYGYRVQAVTSLGTTSSFTPVIGVITPPEPGVVVTTVAVGNYIDPDGYLATLTTAGESVALASRTIAANERTTFAPLASGNYVVTLSGLDPLCGLSGDASQPATVDDSGVATLDTVAFVASCLDPDRGQVRAVVQVTGGGNNGVPFVVALEGIAGGVAIVDEGEVAPTGGTATFSGLEPGDYQVTLRGLAEACTATDLTRALNVEGGTDQEVVFEVTCRPVIENPSEGYELRGTWSQGAGDEVVYTLVLDMSTFDDPAVNGTDPDDISAISASTTFDPAVLTFVAADNAASSGLTNAQSNETSPGTIAWFNFSSESGLLTGLQPVITFRFRTVAGASLPVQPLTVFGAFDEVRSASGFDLKPRMIRLEEVFTPGGGGSAPTAEANGPYSGIVNTPVSFTSSGSTAAAGRTLVAFAWTFSDGTSATGANPTKAFAAPGSYTATLTVTDDQGDVDTDVASVTIASTGGTDGYVLAGTWSPVTAGAATYRLTFDLTGRDDPAIPGPDDLAVISGSTTYDAARLDFTSASNVPGSLLQSQNAQAPTPGRVNWLNFSTAVAPATGVVGVIDLVFTVRPGATGTVTPVTTFGAVDDVLSLGGVNLKPTTTIQDGAVNLGGGDGGMLSAEANGPYTGSVGVPVSLTASGSTAGAGQTIVSYAWAFSDGTTATGANPSKTFAAAGAFTATLTVTDGAGAAATDVAQVTISGGSDGSLIWSSSFGAIDPGTRIVTLTVSLDLQTNLPETPGPEALGTFELTSLTWDPAVLQYRGYSVPTGNAYTVQVNSAGGSLAVPRATVAPGNSMGLVSIIEVRFAVTTTSGATSATETALGSVLGTAATGTFDYSSRIVIQEATLTVP
jgi:PKD repeat protein